jgi:two-component system sensor histidine kinase HydH
VSEPTHPEGDYDHRRIAVCAFLLIVVSVAHYLISPTHFFWHNVFQRLYYIPLLLAAAWFGLRGGLLAALVCAALYSPHIFLHWAHTQAYQISQAMELAMMFLLGAMAGVLSDRERIHRRRAEDLAIERDEALVNLRDTIDSLRRADRLATLGTLAAGMAHELRNPLAAMTGAVEILENELPDQGTSAEFVSILRQEVERLNKVSGKYIDFARPQEPDLRTLDINECIQSAVELLLRSAAKARVEIRFIPAAGIPPALADSVQVHQALVNLLLNGVQSMPQGGVLEVSVKADKAGVCILVRDHGPGLPPGPAERIFEPFFSTKEGGTGLGLAVTRQIASAHGGRLTADGAPGGGAIFCLQLPAAGAGGSS